MGYEWLKVVHVLAVISWMAGLFYLPRLFVYHSGVLAGSESSETFKVMERRLLKAIMRPACLVTLVSGPLVMWAAGFSWLDGWVHGKLLGVAGLVVFHGLLEVYVARFQRDERPGSGRYFRILNEVPTVLLVWIAICVVVKPFS